ncbi:GntR family transcriptional regulator [Qiania dongpingensis]|uniref:GntR family transcriptional regulator n=1 Tax=Qiania dongpingensis TaxID=2763669 RepID=A0A7G9G1U0_9FIRM|nr:GntR family transcriptional regulator [Qiania dongpingensis]QNM04772.1 GntR family transcriptional regulator [Qiania dongpingensis]
MMEEGRAEEISEKKQTLFAFVYQSLLEQITAGRLAYGGRLPSMKELCGIYHVSMRTVRDVLAALKKDGYIWTEERKPAVVVFGRDAGNKGERNIRDVLSERVSIFEVYETMAILMPRLYSVSAAFCSTEDFIKYDSAIKRGAKKDIEGTWRVTSAVFHDILQKSNNLLFNDLYTSMELYTQIPVEACSKEEHPFRKMVSKEKMYGMRDMVNSLKRNYLPEVEVKFAAMYRRAAAAVRKYEDQQPNKRAEQGVEQKASYVWNAEKRRNCLYTHIGRELIKKIGTGEYPAGSRIPSEAALVREYGVSLATVRKAAAMLNELGFAQTVNGKGTYAKLPDKGFPVHFLEKETYRQDLLLYMSALQFMAVSIGPAVLQAFDRIDLKVTERRLKEKRREGELPITVLTATVIENIPLEPMKEIFMKLERLLQRGYYLFFFRYGNRSLNTLRQRSLAAVHYLQIKDGKGFAEELASGYRGILKSVQGFALEYGVEEAGGIAVPSAF